MYTVSLDKATVCLPELVQHALDGEPVFIRDGSQQVRLVPSPVETAERHAGSATAQVWISEDFDAPLDEFAEFMTVRQEPHTTQNAV